MWDYHLPPGTSITPWNAKSFGGNQPSAQFFYFHQRESTLVEAFPQT